jgi:ankyrin repeat protein
VIVVAAAGSPSNDDFVSAVCVEVNTVKARATGQAKEAPEIARLLCQTVMADWRSQGCSADPGQELCKKRLASFDGSLNASGSSMLFAAARAGQASICSAMLGMRSDPNAAISTSWTPVMIAAQEGHVDVVRILVAAGADPNARNSAGSTALDLAATAGKANVVEALQKSAADGR